MGQQFDNRQKNDLKIDPKKNDTNLEQATAPDVVNRDEVRRQFKSVDQRKGAEVLNQGVADRSKDLGRDAILDPGRYKNPEMISMIATVVFPELSATPTPQGQAFLKAFENPAIIRSYLINPQETAAYLMERFPEQRDMILKNMPFQKIGNHLEVNPASGVYQYTLQELDSGIKMKDTPGYKQMDKLLSSPIGARLGGSAGLETKAIELIDNRIQNEGRFNKKGAQIEADISNLMKSPQAQQDLREVQGLAAQGPALSATPTTPISTTTPGASGAIPVQGGGTVDAATLKPAQPQMIDKSKPAATAPGGVPVQGGGAVNPADLKIVQPPSAAKQEGVATTPTPAAGAAASPAAPTPGAPEVATGPAPANGPAAGAAAGIAAGAATGVTGTGAASGVAPGIAAGAAAAAAATGATPGATTTPPATTPTTPATPAAPPAANAISAREQMLADQVAQLEAQLKKEATPTPATPAPAAQAQSEEMKQMSEKLSRIEKLLEQTLKSNEELKKQVDDTKKVATETQKKLEDAEKKIAGLEKKNADLSKKNEELEKKAKELTEKDRDADKKAKDPEKDKKDLSYEEIKDKAKSLYDSMNRIGTDEALLLKTLSQLDKEGQKKVADFYSKTYNEDLDEAIASELSGSDLETAKKLREGAVAGTAEAVQIFNAVDGAGTDEAAIRAALKDKTPEEAKAIAGEYQRLFGESVEVALRGDLSGADLEAALKVFHQGAMEKAASELYTAMDGIGTNVPKIMRSLAKLDAKQQEELTAAYKKVYGADLDKELEGELSGVSLSSVKELRKGAAPGTEQAVELYLAMDGLGTDEEKIEKAIKDKTSQQMSEIATQYRKLYGTALTTDLKGDLSGEALDNSLKNLKGPTYDLNALLESGTVGTSAGYTKAFGLIRENPAMVQQYKDWYGKDPVQDLNQNQGVIDARKRREEAQKTLRETEFLNVAPATPAAPPSETLEKSPTTPTGPAPRPDVTLNSMVDLLNQNGSGDMLQVFLVENMSQLSMRTDEELVAAFRQVKPAELAKFSKSFRNENGGLSTEILSKIFLSEEEAKQMERLAALADQATSL